MKKLAAYAFAATVAATLIAPTLASAQDVKVRIGDDRGYSRDYDRSDRRDDRRVYRGVRAEFRGHHDRGLHRGWRNRDRVVVIKRRHHHWD